MPSYRNPSGITDGYTTLDEMLPALPKLFTTLFYKDFLSIHNVEAGLCNLTEFAALEVVDSFYLSAFRFHLPNACSAINIEAVRA